MGTACVLQVQSCPCCLSSAVVLWSARSDRRPAAHADALTCLVLQVTNDAQKAHMLALSPSGEVSLERFAQLLAMHGHHVWLRTGRLDCCCGQVALRHTFILAGSSGGPCCVVGIQNTALHGVSGKCRPQSTLGVS